MEGFIESGFDHLEPLMDFRDWLAKARNDPAMRMIERRNGTVTFMKKNEKPILGPFTLDARQEILNRVLALQEEVGVPLISKDEVALIKKIWVEDAITSVQRASATPTVEAET